MEILINIVHIIEYVVFAYLFMSTAYILIYSVAGIFYHEKEQPEIPNTYRKFAVLIPGYKEDAVIVNVAQKALLQDYPKDRYEVIVIADSFSEDTLRRLRELPITVVVVTFEVSKKSKALNKCMEVIGDNYDIAFILDADNIMKPDVLSRINNHFEEGKVAVQGHRTALNNNADFAILDGISEEINNHIFRRGHRVLGISSALIGSGMGIEYALFKSTMATIDSVGEDKEVELKLIRAGMTIDYDDKALIYDEKTQKSQVFVNQRRRWIAAQLAYFRTYFFDGFKQLLLKGNIDYFDKVIQMIQPPRILLAGVLTILSLLSGLLALVSFGYDWMVPDWTWWLALLIGTALALILAVPGRYYTKRTFRALLKLPMGFFLMLTSLLRIRGAGSKFLHTTHGTPADNQTKG